MGLYQILTLFFGSGVLTAVCGFFYKRIKANEKETEAVRLGVQALLRDRLIDEYNKALERGYAPIYAKENFENMWKQYHDLGKNGVMDEIHNEYILFPTEKEDD